MGLLNTFTKIFRINAKKLDDKIQPSADASIDLDIADSEKQAVEFRSKISKLNAHSKTLERQAEAKKQSVKKFEGMAAKAAGDGNEDATRQILVLKSQAATELTSLKQQIRTCQKDVENARSQLNKMTAKISNAKSGKDRLRVRKASAEIRSSLAEASSTIGGKNDPLSKLDDFQQEVEQMEAEAEAIEEEVGLEPDNVAAGLEEQYGSEGDDSVDDELAALMAKNKKKPTKANN